MWEQSDANTSSAAGGFMSSNTPQVSSRSRNETVVPVTCAMIKETLPAAEGVQIGKFMASKLKVIGKIVSCDRKEISETYQLDDGTSDPISVRRYLNVDAPPEEPVEIDSYAKVIGNLRSYDDELYINAFSVIPLANMDELKVHACEVKLAKLYYEKELFEKRVERNSVGGGRDTTGVPSGSYANPGMAGSRSQAGGSQAIGKASATGLTDKHDKMLEMIKTSRDESGADVNDIARHFRLSPDDVKKMIEPLLTEGFIYSTIDDDHYKSSDAV